MDSTTRTVKRPRLGHSTETHRKHDDLKQILQSTVRANAHAANRCQSYTDCTLKIIECGSGKGDFTEIALDCVRGYDIQYSCIERSSRVCKFLRKRFSLERDYTVVQSDYEAYLQEMANTTPNYGAERRGYTIIDMNGPPTFRGLTAFAIHPKYQRVDTIIYISAANLKRQRRSPIFSRSLTLVEHLNSLKKFWFIRELRGRSQWTILYGTHWLQCPVPSFMHLTSSETGSEILTHANFTADEIKVGFRVVPGEASRTIQIEIRK